MSGHKKFQAFEDHTFSDKLFCSVNFFPPKFFLFRKISLFQNTRKNFGGKKIN
jgi:hypothetical protein